MRDDDSKIVPKPIETVSYQKQIVEITKDSISVDTLVYLILKLLNALVIVALILGVVGSLIFFVVSMLTS